MLMASVLAVIELESHTQSLQMQISAAGIRKHMYWSETSGQCWDRPKYQCAISERSLY